MTQIRFILKNGIDFIVKCKSCSVTKNNLTGGIESYKIEGIKENRPMYIDFSEIAAIVQLDPSKNN